MKTIRYSTMIVGMMVLIPVICAGENFHGKIVKSKGDVVIRNLQGEERTPEVTDYIAVADEEINTRSGGRAVVKFTNGSMTVIGENSSLGIEKPTLFAQLKGKILFAFAKDSGPTRMVRTPSAVFGVRATTFVVENNEDGESLALKEGLVHVESPGGAFEIHQKTEQNELDALKAEMEQGVRDMKKEGEAFIQQEKDEYVAFKKSFLVKPDQVIRIKGNRVDQGPMESTDKSTLQDLEDFGQEYLNGFRD